MIAYLLKSATCLALLLFFYYLVLEREKMHNFNRFYLIGSVFFSFLAPLYVIYIDAAPIIIENATTSNIAYHTENIPTEIIIENTFDYNSILIIIYFIISAILCIRLGKNLFNIIHKTKKNTAIPYQKAILILVDDQILPHTFWNYIFINKNDYENKKIEKELFTHELTHVTQKHTLDIILLELLHAIFWINPFFILLKKAVQLNHEFLADERVIHQHKNTIQYQHLLVNKAAWKNEYYLASNLNYSLTKKRLKMMTTQSSGKKILLKKLAVIPLLAGFVFLFAERVEAQEVQENVETIVEDVPFKKDDLSNSEIYKNYFYKNLTIQRKGENGNTISKKYSELNDEEKARLMPPPPLKSKRIIPSKAQFEALKNSEKFAVWIDGKVVKNELLNTYKHTDFARYFNSHVYKNARSKRFPQENQANLETTAYFNAQNKKRVEKFMNYIKEDHNIIEIQEDKGNIKIIEIQEDPKFHKNWYITINSDKYYYTFDKNERIARYYLNGKLVNLDIVKEYKKKHLIFEKLKSTGKHYVFKTNKEQKEIDREFSDLGGMYFRMSKADKNKVTRPETPVKPYLKLRKNNKVFYKLRSELTEEDKLLIPPPPPVPNASEEEILRSKKAYKAWKKRTGNDFAPPPPPKNHLDQVIEMAKKGAKFYYEKEPIHSDKAIALLKKNKNLTIHSESTNNSNYKVWISKTPIKK
ncbi:M56 family metallopeptidase [Polaribacter sp. R77954]|uniref:M56 family metallopeptidase n=1 Tax=Polaribacter sp. R77954 TaxID=3093870 RepID=UPI0037C7D517